MKAAENWRTPVYLDRPCLAAKSSRQRLLRGLLCGDPRHFAKTIVREILRLPFFDGLQNEAGHEFRLVALGVIGRRSSAGRIAHPVLAEVRRRDEWIDFTNGDAVRFKLGACREAEAKKRAL